VLRVDVQRLGQPALQQLAVAAEARQAGLHAARHAVHEYAGGDARERGAHGVAALRRAHLQGGQARGTAFGEDGPAGRGKGPARLGAAGVDAEAKGCGVGLRFDHDRSSVYAVRVASCE